MFKGWAFDTCRAPSLGTMRAWRRHSDYRAVGVYFGGRGRHCKHQPNLDRIWLQDVHALGWGVLPLYVGSQPPCVFAKNKQNVRIGPNPARQGRAEGRDAVSRARAHGFRQGSPLYLDVESYDLRDAKCRARTLSFVRAWNREVRGKGYVTGFYSSADSGVRHMELARRKGVTDLPEVVWFARWGVKPNLNKEPVFRPGAWYPHKRIHQYKGDVKEKHGGRTLHIDRNIVDAPVARIG
ncbi:glycoside hydrolase domain-containing protein [Streptomyces sp. Da 82-17]|uniref:glycoside hydrolase domain-containing protein n=1 Tax=Streptomyces sp. Da 82-17 TaxID=3377116 RepID=UPI0038D441BE